MDKERAILMEEIKRLLEAASCEALRCAYILLLRMG